ENCRSEQPISTNPAQHPDEVRKTSARFAKEVAGPLEVLAGFYKIGRSKPKARGVGLPLDGAPSLVNSAEINLVPRVRGFKSRRPRLHPLYGSRLWRAIAGR